MPPGYETVTLVTNDGQKIRGAKKNEDVFSIQMMDTRERIQGHLRSSLREVTYETTSLMPVFGPDRLNDADLGDLVAYLSTLRMAARLLDSAGALMTRACHDRRFVAVDVDRLVGTASGAAAGHLTRICSTG